MSIFSLKKWYADCVDERGTAWIGYSAGLRWFGVPVSYHASILSGAPVAERSWLGGAAPPVVAGSLLTWSDPFIGVQRVEMRARVPAASLELVSRAQGRVVWNCIAPLADAEVDAGGAILSGKGYAELLEMDVAPWRLGIDEILWGRFTSASTSLVWIDCPGATPIRRLLRDGVEIGLQATGSSTVLASDGSRLELSAGVTLRDERLSTTIRRLGFLSLLVPRSIREAREQKWLCRATLSEAGGARVEGWVIHERVVFSRSA